MWEKILNLLARLLDLLYPVKLPLPREGQNQSTPTPGSNGSGSPSLGVQVTVPIGTGRSTVTLTGGTLQGARLGPLQLSEKKGGSVSESKPPAPQPAKLPESKSTPSLTPAIVEAGPRYPYVYDPQVPGRRVFNDAAVQRVLDEKIAALPEGQHGAVIAHLDSDKNASLSIVAKVGEHWTLVETTDYSPKTKLGASGDVRYSW